MIVIQNRYVGDIGDFGKYGLLRSLCIGYLKLGVVWYLVHDENNNDGKFTNYLMPTRHNINRFKRCDPELYDTLKEVVNNGSRNVASIRMTGVLPAGTVYYEEPLSYSDLSSSGIVAKAMRLECRKNWLQEALDVTTNCDVIFFDPDNGLEVNSVKRHQNKGSKYVYLDEIEPFLKRGQSIIIYHHLCRNGTAEDQINYRLKQVMEHVQLNPIPWAILNRRYTLRIFIVIPTPEHQLTLLQRTENFLKTRWSQHFDIEPYFYRY